MIKGCLYLKSKSSNFFQPQLFPTHFSFKTFFAHHFFFTIAFKVFHCSSPWMASNSKIPLISLRPSVLQCELWFWMLVVLHFQVSLVFLSIQGLIMEDFSFIFQGLVSIFLIWLSSFLSFFGLGAQGFKGYNVGFVTLKLVFQFLSHTHFQPRFQLIIMVSTLSTRKRVWVTIQHFEIPLPRWIVLVFGVKV